jgi:hypothetical protein
VIECDQSATITTITVITITVIDHQHRLSPLPPSITTLTITSSGTPSPPSFTTIIVTVIITIDITTITTMTTITVITVITINIDHHVHHQHHHHHYSYSNSGREIQQAFQKIASELQEHYPGHILPTKHREWVMHKYSGMTLSMTILHASLTEYVLLTGSALDTDGYLGTHATLKLFYYTLIFTLGLFGIPIYRKYRYENQYRYISIRLLVIPIYRIPLIYPIFFDKL